MLVNVQNENYGASVATHDDWVIVGNPPSFKYDPLSSSFFRTGSIDIFRYNTLIDQHDLILTLYKPQSSTDVLLLSEDPTSEEIHTDEIFKYWIPKLNFYNGYPVLNWVRWSLNDVQIQIDADSYITTYEDYYGGSLDVYNDVLAVGSKYYHQYVTIVGKEKHLTGSCVDIYNLSLLNSTPLDGYIGTGSAFLSQTIEPPAGESMSGSFGSSVSINDEWLAIGSPDWNLTLGGVHLYRRTDPANPDNLNFAYFSTITGSSNIVGDYFGYSVDINKQTGSFSGSIIVGCGNKTLEGSKVYFFEFDGVNWKEQFTFGSDRRLFELPFYNVNPIPRCENYTIDGFGNSVALFQDDVAIGAPTDRWIYEYSGSRAYKQGACYFYRRCSDRTKGFYLVQKFYGNESTLKNNKMGFSVDLWDDNCVIGCPKSTAESLSSCYIQGSIFQQNYCYSDLENYIHGQYVLMKKDTSSVDLNWKPSRVFQKKKRYMSPYKSYGFDVAVSNKSVVVGAPMKIQDSNRSLNIQFTSSVIGTELFELDDLSGKAYIYNWNNFRNEFHVGNVFYRNGKIILNTSGSVFEGMWFNPINSYSYEYEIHFDSKQTLYEKQIACIVKPGEFNVSTNPTATTWEKSLFDINGNGYFDWQDMDIILRYMQRLNTRYDRGGAILDWTSSVLKQNDEISYYNFNSVNNVYYNTDSDFVSQSFFKILNTIGESQFDFNQDSKIDLNDLNIFWKYCSNRLDQVNYQSFITPNSQRKLFSDIIDHLNEKTKKNTPKQILPEFLTFTSQSASDKTGSYLAPYVTSIGLYSGLDLVAVAKLGSPIKLTKDFPVNFIVKLDF